jgi:exo-beta-1,3-glucanase (GH17 family)
MPKHKGQNTEINAADLLGNAEYQAISYGGYRHKSRDVQPTIDEIKEDLQIMAAMGIRILRTYNVHHEEAATLLEAIRQLKTGNPEFEMYVMLGAWIDCKNAWTDLPPIHDEESERNETEIARAVELAQMYPDIVKIIAVGNEAMVHWATAYFVHPKIILKWVNHLQELKKTGILPSDLWITSSDNFASWGGGGPEYHNEDLNALIEAVDYISMHTYPMHDTHYNPAFWGIVPSESELPDTTKIINAMIRARDYAVSQYDGVVKYMRSQGANKPVHIGETGWATLSNEHYGPDGSKATDEYKAGIYYKLMQEWCTQNKLSCFYFEAFDEQWKDSANPSGSENHFGLINLQSQAKYALWDLVDNGVFEGFTRDSKKISKTYNGNREALLKDVRIPPLKVELQTVK